MKLGQAIVFALVAGVLLSGPKPAAAATITDAQLTDYINRMSLEEQIGQLFVAPTPASPTDAQTAVAKYHLGGLILFGRDLTGKTAAQVAAVVRADQAKAKVPLLIATDQEGGSVSRLSSSLTYANTPFPSPQAANRAGGMAKVLAAARTAQEDLAALGVNWNFAPVADVSTNPASFIYARTFGQNYQVTADYIKQVVPVMQSTGVGATLKHFPGYGDQGDTHVGFATSARPLAQLQQRDLLPFQAGIDAGVDGIMVTHIIMTAIDPNYPASLSAKVVTQLLRKQMHYQNVIITDDLSMGAIGDFTRAHHLATADVLAVQAGNDIILHNDYATGIPAIAAAVAKGTISRQQIQAADLRILQLKRKLNLLAAAQFPAAKLTLTRRKFTKRTLTLQGAGPANTTVTAMAGAAKIGTTRTTATGAFSLTLARTARTRHVTLTASSAKRTITIPARRHKQPAKRQAWLPWAAGGAGVVVIAGLAGIATRHRPGRHRRR